VDLEPERSAGLSLSLSQPQRVTRGVHFASVASDKEQNEWVFWSRAAAAMAADIGRRRGEVVRDPLNDTAALFSLALAQHGDNVPFAPPDDSEKAGRRRGGGLKGEIIAVERHANAAVAGQFECVVDGHSRTLQPAVFFSDVGDV
jgi:hypothetical protein